MFSLEAFFGTLIGSAVVAIFFLLACFVGYLFSEDKFVWGSVVVTVMILGVAIVIGFIV